jgi:hypothetical protein
MSWGAQNRSKGAKTPSGSRAMSRKPKLALCGIQLYLLMGLKCPLSIYTPSALCRSGHPPRTPSAALAVFNQKTGPCKKPSLAGKTFPSPKLEPQTPYLTNPIPSKRNRLAVPALIRGLHVVVGPCSPRRGLPFKDTRHPDRITEPMPSKPFIDGR